jgi:tripartite-type tricarboxylate transporter receptor subunit TctC
MHLTWREDGETMPPHGSTVRRNGREGGALRRICFRIGLLAAFMLSVARPALSSDSYPTRPIRIVVGFAAGGVADITVRVVGQRLGELLGQPVVVDNRPSAGGVIATETVATAAPDGYTLLLLTNGAAITQSLFKSLPFNVATDFAPISMIGQFDVVVVTRMEAPYRTVGDLIAAARAKPGSIAIGTINPGSTQHLSAELFKSMAGIDVTLVPFRTTPAVVTALRGNEIQVGFEMLAPIKPQIEAGTMRALAVSSNHRFVRLPAVPTVQESGLPDYQVSSWNSLAAPARTPPEIIERLHREIQRAIAMPEVKQSLLDLGVEPRGSSPEALRELVVAEIERWRAVIRQAGIEPQ